MIRHRLQPEPLSSDTPQTSRRGFLRATGACVAAATCAGAAQASSGAHGSSKLDPDRVGMLVDLTLCVGCRRCEWACNEANGLPHGPLSSMDDTSVFEERRRPTSVQLTVVNQAPEGGKTGEPLTVKSQCMHCEKPACVSACLVGAMRKDPHGAVYYDADRCIGCRYCMVACPFQLPAYEFEKALTPRVMKCTMCRERTAEGQLPACAEICPVEAITFGKRSELLALAHRRINENPDRYIDHIYGEHEAGGTSWLYLSDRPFSDVGFPQVGSESPAELSEAIQHGIFKAFAAPVVLAGLLGALGRVTQK